MKILTPREFAKAYKKQKYNRLVVFGAESAFVRRTLNIVKDSWKVPPESVVEFFDSEGVSLERLADAVSSATLFSQENMVIVREAGAFFKGLSPKEKEVFKSLLNKGVPSTTCLVLVHEVEEDVEPKKDPFLSFLSDCDVVGVNCRRAKPQELKKWLAKKLSKLGMEDEALFDILIAASGGSIEALERELEKLAVGGGEDAVSSVRGYTVYDFVNLLLSGDWKTLEALDYLFNTGVQPQYMVAVLQVTLRNILLWEEGVKKFPSFVEDRFRSVLERWGLQRLKRAYEESIKLEQRVKFSSYNELLKPAFELYALSILSG